MAEEKTKYLRNLEMLMQTYKTCYGDCVGDRTINKLSLLIVMFESGEMFEQIAKNLKENLIIDIDRDVDYIKWGKPETWMENKSKNAQTANTLTYESLKIEKDSVFVNNMTDILPPTPQTTTDEKKDKKNLVGLTYAERDKFRDTINNLINKNVFNDQMLDYAIDTAMRKLCAALQKIQKIIESKQDNSLYENLYNSQSFYYRNAIGTKVKEEHENWRGKYLDDEITEESLNEHLEQALVELLKSGVFDEIEANATKEQKSKYKEEIDFEDYDFPRKMKPYDLYTRYRTIYDLKGKTYLVNKVKAGKLLFKIRKDIDKLEAYFKFDQTILHIHKDIVALREKNKIESIKDDIDFSLLECNFNEEEIKASGIKENAKTALPIIELMIKDPEVPKAYWLCFYCVLLENKWIDDNMNDFCNRMQTLFGIKLDSRGLNKDRNKLGADIEQWEDTDGRIKKKKKFGIKFKEYLEFYGNYRLQMACR
nr:hypothetical protein [uncultured Prevotella sp.]